LHKAKSLPASGDALLGLDHDGESVGNPLGQQPVPLHVCFSGLQKGLAGDSAGRSAPEQGYGSGNLEIWLPGSVGCLGSTFPYFDVDASTEATLQINADSTSFGSLSLLADHVRQGRFKPVDNNLFTDAVVILRER